MDSARAKVRAGSDRVAVGWLALSPIAVSSADRSVPSTCTHQIDQGRVASA